MQDKLGAFLSDAAGRTADYDWDCGLWLADWYMVATGKSDPAPEYRGSRNENAALIRSIIRRTGLVRTKSVGRGDIGLISIAKGHLVGAIFNGWHWIVLADGGGLGAVSRRDCRFQAAWRIA